MRFPLLAAACLCALSSPAFAEDPAAVLLCEGKAWQDRPGNYLIASFGAKVEVFDDRICLSTAQTQPYQDWTEVEPYACYDWYDADDGSAVVEWYAEEGSKVRTNFVISDGEASFSYEWYLFPKSEKMFPNELMRRVTHELPCQRYQ